MAKDVKKKVVLFRPKQDKYDRFILCAPLSLLAVSSLLDKEGYTIKIVDAIVAPNYKSEILKEMEDSVCLGISVITGYPIKDALDVCREVKKKFPGKPIVWGGWHPTIIPKETIKNRFVDVVVKGYGERTFYELVKALYEQRPLESVDGILYKNKGKIIENNEREIEDINSFPEMPYHLLNMYSYIKESPFSKRILDYRSSMGCAFNCTFCAEEKMSKRRWSGLESDRVIREIKSLKEKYDLDSIRFFENNFFLDKIRVREICEGMIKQKLGIKWGNANGRPEQLAAMDDRLWALIKKSGCNDILIGTESGSDKILKLINKQAKVEDTLKVIKQCKKYNIRPLVSLMFGFPFESKGITLEYEFRQLVKLVKEIYNINTNVLVVTNIYAPYPGTPLYSSCVKEGLLTPLKSLEEWGEVDLSMAYTKWVPKKYVRRINQLNEFISPFICEELNISWSRKKKNFLLRVMYSILRKCAMFRIQHGIFALPVEYYMLKGFTRLKAVLIRKKMDKAAGRRCPAV